jgi:hypothetical protein
VPPPPFEVEEHFEKGDLATFARLIQPFCSEPRLLNDSSSSKQLQEMHNNANGLFLKRIGNSTGQMRKGPFTIDHLKRQIVHLHASYSPRTVPEKLSDVDALVVLGIAQFEATRHDIGGLGDAITYALALAPEISTGQVPKVAILQMAASINKELRAPVPLGQDGNFHKAFGLPFAQSHSSPDSYKPAGLSGAPLGQKTRRTLGNTGKMMELQLSDSKQLGSRRVRRQLAAASDLLVPKPPSPVLSSALNNVAIDGDGAMNNKNMNENNGEMNDNNESNQPSCRRPQQNSRDDMYNSDHDSDHGDAYGRGDDGPGRDFDDRNGNNESDGSKSGSDESDSNDDNFDHHRRYAPSDDDGESSGGESDSDDDARPRRQQDVRPQHGQDQAPSNHQDLLGVMNRAHYLIPIMSLYAKYCSHPSVKSMNHGTKLLASRKSRKQRNQRTFSTQSSSARYVFSSGPTSI